MVQVHSGPPCTPYEPPSVPSTAAPHPTEGPHRMKKLLVVLLAVLGGLFAYRRVQASRVEQDLWAEATDPVR